MSDEFQRRVRRLYASVGEIEVQDLSQFARLAGATRTGAMTSGTGPTPAQLENVAVEMILNVAHIRDGARKTAKALGRDPADVDRAISGNDALKIVLDLAERDKHGGDRRDGGLSRQNPRLSRLIRGVELGAPRSESVHITFGPSGLVATPEGLLSIVLNGPIVNSKDETVGYFKDVIQEALRGWEDLFRKWGIIDGAA